MSLKTTETDLGFEIVDENYVCFFGKATATLDQIKKQYSHFQFREIHQTHSDILINSNEPSDLAQEADAHWTSQMDTALLVRTADCLPVMVWDSKLKIVVAIHAGWKGVANQIAKKSLQQLGLKQVNVVVGPHILQKSFEVKQDVYQALCESCSGLVASDTFNQISDFYYINLSKIVEAQVMSVAEIQRLYSLDIDTKTHSQFHSYRRDKNCGRNYSFIAISSR